MLCDGCGRLLNRATGRCVCEDYGGNAPPPVAVTHPPPERLEPVSKATAVAVLDLSDRPMREIGHRQAEIPASPCPDPVADEFRVVLRPSLVDEDAIARHARKRWVKRIGVAVGGAVLFAAVFVVASKVFAPGPPAPPPPPPPVTLPPVEVAARAELASTCPPWLDFAAGVPNGERPDPKALGPVVNALRPHLVASAGAVADYAEARDEAEYLQGYAKRSQVDIERESVSRVHYALDKVTAACARATGGASA